MDTNALLAWFVAEVKGSLPTLRDRVFPDFAPEGTKNPCLVYQFVGTENEVTVDGGAAKDGTLAFQVRIYAGTRKEANALRDSFRERFEGICPRSIGGGQRIEGSAWGDLADTFERETMDFGALGVVEFHLAGG